MSEIFSLIIKIAEKQNVLPIQDSVWEFQVDEYWAFKVNGHRESKDGILPFHVLVEFNGFPAGMIGYDGGVIAAGDAANEDAFIDALQTMIAA